MADRKLTDRILECAVRVQRTLGAGFLEKVIIELKAAAGISPAQSACCMNYVRATGLSVCLLLNFGATTLQIKRIVGDSYINEPNPL